MSIETEELRLRIIEVLEYDKSTGLFRWKKANGPVKNRLGSIAGTKSQNQSGKVYIRIKIDGKSYRAHRLAWLCIHGVDPGPQMDHENGDGIDNRIENLKPATALSNAKNRRLRSDNKTGRVGVHIRKDRGTFLSTIKHEGKMIGLGSFYSVDEAAEARRIAEIEYGYHKNHGQERPL